MTAPTYADALATVRHNSAAASTTYTADEPANAVTGDLLFVEIYLRANTTTPNAPPTGWNFIRQRDSSSTICILTYWGLVANVGAGPYAFSGTTSALNSCATSRIQGFDSINPINTSNDFLPTSSTTAVVYPAVTTTVTDTLVLIMTGVATNNTQSAWSTGFTEGWDASSSNGGSRWALSGASGAVSAAGNTGTFASTASGGAIYPTVTVAIAPAVNEQVLTQTFQPISFY